MFKIGIGYDIHRLAEGRNLIIGGVTVPHSKGLVGHSDADVLVHAIMDAILGATGRYDIGFYFPDSDIRWKGADSLGLLRHVLRISEIGQSFLLCNVDTILIAEKPRLSPFIDMMREKLAKELALPFSCVTVKVTTNEGMGPEGHEEGISAHAAALVEVIRESGNLGGNGLRGS